MSDQSLETTATDAEQTSQAQTAKTYTQEEFDRHMAGMKASLAKKYEKQYADLGDIEELRALKLEAEQRKTEQQMKKGEFEKILQEKADKWNAEIQKRDQVIKEYKINTPLLSAAAQFRAVNAEQVKNLLINNVRLNTEGEVEVVGQDGGVRYTDSGQQFGVNDLVREFLDSNPHFVQPTPATTNSRSNVQATKTNHNDISKLDMKNPEHRKIYAEYRKSAGII